MLQERGTLTVRFGNRQARILSLKRSETDTRSEYWPGERGRRLEAWQQEAPGASSAAWWSPLLPALPTQAPPTQHD